LTIKTPVKPLRVTTPIRGVSLEEAPGVGDYKILEKIASGGMANVYKAVHIKKGWMVALKVPHEQFQSDRTFVERFRREGELGKKLHNENIIHIYESATAKDGFTYIAMEYLEGIDLRQYMDKHGKLPIEEALNIIVHVCRALDYAHVKGVVHRDIKPENIMLPLQKGKGKIVLMDFGIAHTASLGTLGTGSTYLGTPYYMSPDQISSKEVDGRSDIYSLGVVLFEMLTGQHLFDEPDPLKVLFHHKETAPRRPSTVNPRIPPTLEQIVLKMLTKKPDERYQTVENLLVELQEFMLKEGIENE
jgi:serine/threonine protein kinase